MSLGHLMVPEIGRAQRGVSAWQKDTDALLERLPLATSETA